MRSNHTRENKECSYYLITQEDMRLRWHVLSCYSTCIQGNFRAISHDVCSSYLEWISLRMLKARHRSDTQEIRKVRLLYAEDI